MTSAQDVGAATPPERLRVGVVGGGFITQAVHLPTLVELADRFELVALVDPSPRVRDVVGRRFAIPRAFADHRAMLDAVALDAVLVLSPGATHRDVIADALDGGLHVFTEKPLCLASADAEGIAAHAQRTGRVVQVGTMKRHDRSFERLLADVGEDGTDLRLIAIATHDPGLERFFAPADVVMPDDVPEAARAALRASRGEQVARAVGVEDPELARIYVELFTDTLVHDVDLLVALLRRLDLVDGLEVVDAGWWADGRAMAGTIALRTGARCTLSLLELPGVQDFREELRLSFRDALHTISFPSPYVRHAPSRYEHVTERDGLSHTATWGSWEESFVTELVHFHHCVHGRATCLTPAADAIDDLRLLEALFRAGLRGPAVRR